MVDTVGHALGIIFKRDIPSMRSWVLAKIIAGVGALLLSSQLGWAQFTQQGQKLTGNDAVGESSEGTSVAVSADGNTAIVGGSTDNSSVGAAWIFTRSNGAWTQQGSKLVGTGAVGNAPQQGISVALSADGNTAIVGGFGDHSDAGGAVWVFTRSDGVWTQQGTKLVGTSAVGFAQQGQSVALSGDGNTAIVGGPADNSLIGAVWVFTRSNGVWTQQGSKLVGTGGTMGLVLQGTSVSISSDGNTAIVGGPSDGSGVGAVWVFTRSNGVWTQQGDKLVGNNPVGAALQGASVALSGDGNTAIVGGPNDNSDLGAVWVFTQNNGVWTQQGSKLVGTGTVGSPVSQGQSLALSGDGNTAIVGGPNDNSFVGAVWVFTRTNGAWTQQDGKLAGTGAVGGAQQGNSVALSASGNTAIVGGPADNSLVGAAWVFVQRPSEVFGTNTHDFNGDGYSDIAFRDTFGDVAIWLMNGTTILNANTSFVANGLGSTAIVGQRDFNGDGFADLLLRDTRVTAGVYIWEMNGTTILNRDSSSISGVQSIPFNWSIVGTGDFNGDGPGDILWQDTTGNVVIWEMNGTTILNQNTSFVATVPGQWSIKGTGDFNGDGMSDILWQDTSGNVAIWEMNGTTILNANTSFIATVPGQWSIKGTGDFNGDGTADILWQDTSGNVAIWEMNGTSVLNANTSFVAQVPGQWLIQLTGDYNGDGMSDILWQDTFGNVAIWEMNGTAVLNANSSYVGTVSSEWPIQQLGAD
jgi:hypothetical protein